MDTNKKHLFRIDSQAVHCSFAGDIIRAYSRLFFSAPWPRSERLLSHDSVSVAFAVSVCGAFGISGCFRRTNSQCLRCVRTEVDQTTSDILSKALQSGSFLTVSQIDATPAN